MEGVRCVERANFLPYLWAGGLAQTQKVRWVVQFWLHGVSVLAPRIPQPRTVERILLRASGNSSLHYFFVGLRDCKSGIWRGVWGRCRAVRRATACVVVGRSRTRSWDKGVGRGCYGWGGAGACGSGRGREAAGVRRVARTRERGGAYGCGGGAGWWWARAAAESESSLAAASR